MRTAVAFATTALLLLGNAAAQAAPGSPAPGAARGRGLNRVVARSGKLVAAALAVPLLLSAGGCSSLAPAPTWTHAPVVTAQTQQAEARWIAEQERQAKQEVFEAGATRASPHYLRLNTDGSVSRVYFIQPPPAPPTPPPPASLGVRLLAAYLVGMDPNSP